MTAKAGEFSWSQRVRSKLGKRIGGILIIGFIAALFFLPRYKLHALKSRIRRNQVLRGFDEERVNQVIPKELRQGGSLEQLLSHPLLTSVQPLNCSLNSYHRQRYAPLFSNYTSKLSTKSSLRNRFKRDQPFKDLNYLIGINLIDAAAVLPSLIRAIVSLEAITKGGTSRKGKFHISILENGSKDATPAQLYLFAKILTKMRVGFTIESDVTTGTKSEGSRIATLARLRNAVLNPVFDSPPGTFDRVLFLNDVHLCETDLLELLYSHEIQKADMTCGMDYKELEIIEFRDIGYPLMFYDTWVARDMEGLYVAHLSIMNVILRILLISIIFQFIVHYIK